MKQSDSRHLNSAMNCRLWRVVSREICSFLSSPPSVPIPTLLSSRQPPRIQAVANSSAFARPPPRLSGRRSLRPNIDKVRHQCCRRSCGGGSRAAGALISKGAGKETSGLVPSDRPVDDHVNFGNHRADLHIPAPAPSEPGSMLSNRASQPTQQPSSVASITSALSIFSCRASSPSSMPFRCNVCVRAFARKLAAAGCKKAAACC